MFQAEQKLNDPLQLSEYPHYEIWDAEGESQYEHEAIKDESSKGSSEDEDKDDFEESTLLAFTEFVSQFELDRAKELEAREREKKEQLERIIGIQREEDASDETLITPELEITVSVESSSDSSCIHPCLKDIDISDSRLKLLNLYTMFPVPDDPGLAPAFWTIHKYPPNYDDDGIDKFFDIAKESRVKPIQSMKEMLTTNSINLQYYGIDSRVVKALCEALINNVSVEVVNLEDNWLSEDACYHLNDLLLRNHVIHTLVLSGCRIGPEGVKRLSEGISDSTSLITLDLSSCNLRAKGFAEITNAACTSSSLTNLILNKNQLDTSCTADLLLLVSRADTLTRLELSWNSLNTVALWRPLRRAFDRSRVLAEVDLSWNALGKECVRFIGLLLSRSTVLKKLNLSGNRFYDDDVPPIARGLSRNRALHEIYLGNNPLKAPGVLALVLAVTPERAANSQLRRLDLANVWAKKDILPVLEKIEQGRPTLRIILGGILSNYPVVGPDVKKILFKRANYEAMRPRNRRQRRNFGHFVLTLTDRPISRGKFQELVKTFRLKLSQTLVTEIMSAFLGRRRRVDQALLKATYLEQYPDTKPPVVKKDKKKKVRGVRERKAKVGK